MLEVRADGPAAPAQTAALDLHEGICDPRAGCKRWPEHLRLLNRATGELVEGRCKATNLCEYCRTLAVVETAEMLQLDATEYAPTLLLTLTAREHLTRAACYGHLRQLRRAAKKRWAAIEWFVQVEFQKRGALHLHLLVKGVDVADADELQELARETWCRRVDAVPAAQQVKPVAAADGLIRYLQKELVHGLKREQAPPIGWRGHRTSQTRGYLVRPASVMRVEAKASLRVKRELRKAIANGLEGEIADIAAREAVAAAAADTWELYQLHKSGGTPAPGRPGSEVRAFERLVVELEWRRELANWREQLEAGSEPAQRGAVSPAEGLRAPPPT